MGCKFLGAKFFESLEDDLSNIKESLVIISPFVNKYAVKELMKIIVGKKLSLSFITRPIGMEYVNGGINPEALIDLEKADFNLWSISKLHSKIYIIDDKIAYIGSANFTESRIEHNIEEMVKIKLTKEDLDYIQGRYLSEDVREELAIDEKFKLLISELKAKFKSVEQQYRQVENEINELIADKKNEDRYKSFLKKIKSEHAISEYRQQKKIGTNTYLINNKFVAKLMVSKRHEGVKDFEVNFKYSLSVKGKQDAIANKISVFLLIMEGEQEYQYVCLPMQFLKKSFFITKNFDGQKRSWQFQVSLANGITYLRTRGRNDKESFNISLCKNKINFQSFPEIKKVAVGDLK